MDIKVDSNIQEVGRDLTNRLKNADGKIIDDQFMESKIELAQTDRQAWINYIVDQYEKKQSFKEPPPELNITKEDIVQTISKRAIERILGKK